MGVSIQALGGGMDSSKPGYAGIHPSGFPTVPPRRCRDLVVDGARKGECRRREGEPVEWWQQRRWRRRRGRGRRGRKKREMGRRQADRRMDGDGWEKRKEGWEFQNVVDILDGHRMGDARPR